MKKTLLPLFLSALMLSSGCAGQISQKKNEDSSGLVKANKKYIDNARARWISSDTITWQIPLKSEEARTYNYYLYYSDFGNLSIRNRQVVGGQGIKLDANGVITENDPLYKKYPYLKGHVKISTAKLDKTRFIPQLLRGNVLIVIKDSEDKVVDATQIQNYGILDQLYTYKDDLGINFSRFRQPTLRIWAPTAKSVRLFIYKNSGDTVPEKIRSMDDIPSTGVWEFKGNESWVNKYYLYEVQVYSPISGNVETNYVTDPYSISLSTDSKKSQIIDFSDRNLTPQGWDNLQKPELNSMSDISIYELHVRDFSIRDKSVIPKNRGKFLAFTERNSNGMNHLKELADAGLTHIHLLPVSDMSSVYEDTDKRKEADPNSLATYPASSSIQQQLVGSLRKKDGYNWGYDPYHFSTPEGSYSSNPEGSTRILEFREAIKSLNDQGLRVIMDVVYNHTSGIGQNESSVLDKVVPGYYYRLDNNGKIQNTSCCPDTATEHNMMEKLMVDSVKMWAKEYKIDGFRFDLMGHHTKENLRKIREALNSLTPQKDDVDGKKIYLYGEGWKFGSLNDILPEQAMNQQNTSGSGIGTFNDRIRDSARGGSFSATTIADQGFINGLYYDYNQDSSSGEISTDYESQKKELLNYMDNIKIGLAGNLKNYSFKGSSGTVKGSEIPYHKVDNAGYTVSPQENINYISAHDNHTLWDQITAKAPFNSYVRVSQSGKENEKYHTATVEEKVRMQNMGLSLVALGQGIPFFQAGDDMLRSKSGDGDSYDSGDWFNYLDFTYQTNNWAIGLPPEWRNKNEWKFWQPRLSDPKLQVKKENILFSVANFQRLLKIRKSSELFHLKTGQDVIDRLSFLDNEIYDRNDKKYITKQTPGFIAMNLSDDLSNKEKIDKTHKSILTLFNATNESIDFTNHILKDKNLILHPALNESIYIETNGENMVVAPDAEIKKARFDKNSGTIAVPPRTTVVFFEPR